MAKGLICPYSNAHPPDLKDNFFPVELSGPTIGSPLEFGLNYHIMLIIPAIDLRGGQCVRLRQGRAEEMTVFSRRSGGHRPQVAGGRGRWLHVVDLDGAFSGSPKNLAAIRDLRQALNIPMELGGGIRSLDTIGPISTWGSTASSWAPWS